MEKISAGTKTLIFKRLATLISVGRTRAYKKATKTIVARGKTVLKIFSNKLAESIHIPNI